jgi:hypothetical protein
MSGYGHTGRNHEYTTFGPVAQAVSGLTFLSGLPEKPPSGWGWSYMDDAGGLYGAMCALTGLYHRNITGHGQHIDQARMVSGVPLVGHALLAFTVNGRGSRRAGYPAGNRAHWPDTPLINSYRGPTIALHNASCGASRMAETAAYLVDRAIPRVPIRQCVLLFPIPLRILFAAHPEPLTPLQRIVHRVITRFLVKQVGLTRDAADTGAVTLSKPIRLGGRREYPRTLPRCGRGFGGSQANRTFKRRAHLTVTSSRVCSTRSSRG